MPAKPKQDRRSQISRHPERLAIELSKAAGLSLDKIAAKYGVHRDSIARHWNSLSDDYKSMLVADVPLEELAERAAKEGGSLLDHFGIIRMTVMGQMLAAAAVNDRHATANLARAATEVSREIGRLSGDILASPGVTNNITNQAIVFMSSPFMTQLEAMLVRKLAPHPAALMAVQEGLAELQQAQAPAAQVIDARAA